MEQRQPACPLIEKLTVQSPDISSLLATILCLIPADDIATATAVISFVIASCALAVRFWKPPPPSSRWLPLYRVVSALAQARGWNASAYQPGRQAIMIPSSEDRSAAADNLGLEEKDTRP